MATRRGKGDGGLTQRHDHPTCPPVVDGERPPHTCRGRWAGTIDTYEAGRRKRKFVYGRTRKEAQQKLERAKREKAAGTLVVTTTTVERWMTQWLKAKAEPPKALKPQTLRSYESKVRTYVVPHLGRHRLTSLDPRHIDAMYAAMRADGLAESTVRQTHAILKKALRDAVRKGVLAINPIDRADAPGTEKAKRPQLSAGQARMVLASTRDPRWWLALRYGMRQGECLGLRWCDVDLEGRRLRVQQTQQVDTAGRIIFGTPKSAKSARVLPLVPEVVDLLAEHAERTGAREPVVRCDGVTGVCEHGLVFTGAGGRPLQPKADWQAWRRLLADAATPPWAPLPEVALHSARQTAASLMEAGGIQDRVVMQALGQSQVQTTHGYQHADADLLLAAFASTGRPLALE
ncbi:tyrosine-type recombinase/integrase [Nocardioides sp.]|uniref:tyrosine-type recombinase/integrase n=1 Tax=Nocardioides sp. TaxID=35761 RepID=UPI0035111C12